MKLQNTNLQNTKLAEFIDRNGIPSDLLEAELYQLLLLTNLKKLCSRMKRSPQFEVEIRKAYRRSGNDEDTTKRIWSRYCDCNLSDEEARWLTKCIHAYFGKKNFRCTYGEETRTELFRRQNGKCACCGNPIDPQKEKIHIDHIVPWELVGDELSDNLQALCEDCNWKKSNSIDYTFKSLLKLT